MLLRQTAEGVIAVTQPAHAWLAGRLAQSWGNADFLRPAPFDDVCRAAALHDIGWLAFEESPQCDPDTGWPRDFAAVPAEHHTQLWRHGIDRAAVYGAYTALLVSMHGDTIYEKTFDPARARPAAAEAVKAFRAEQKRYQEQTIAAIRQDPRARADVSPEHLAFNKRFIAAVDTLSLNLCWGVTEAVVIADVPASRTAARVVTLEPGGDDTITVDPWPFAPMTIAVTVPGRALTRRTDTDAACRSALAAAPLCTIAATLRAKGPS